ncbi:MAG: hypothetical protein R2710_12610 [Acidimicrobiales bacterium]
MSLLGQFPALAGADLEIGAGEIALLEGRTAIAGSDPARPG